MSWRTVLTWSQSPSLPSMLVPTCCQSDTLNWSITGQELLAFYSHQCIAFPYKMINGWRMKSVKPLRISLKGKNKGGNTF